MPSPASPASPASLASPATFASLALLATLAACSDNEPPEPSPAPAHCVQPEERRAITVNISGTIVDFITEQPVAGATVDITTAWDTEGDIPADDCPLLATVTTDAQGRFGPLPLYAGAGQFLPIMLFRVAGGDRALTLSDNRACSGGVTNDCYLDHRITAPSATLAAQWRAELASGGMADAAHRGLIAFLYKEGSGVPAPGVEPTTDALFLPRPGADVRFVDASRGGLTPATDATTSAAGVAVIGTVASGPAGPAMGRVKIGGRRATERWDATGSLVVPDAIFVEDKTVSPL